MQTTLATLLFVTSAVILACVVVDYTVVIFEQTLETDNLPQMDRIRKIESTILNQTDSLLTEIESFNQKEVQPIDQILP